MDYDEAQDLWLGKLNDVVYAIQLGWSGAEKDMVLSTFTDKAKDVNIKKISVLGSKEKVKWKRTEDVLKLTSPKNKPAEADAALVYKIELK